MVRSGPAWIAERFLQSCRGASTTTRARSTRRDRRFAPILADVGGLARENNLALLNLAASLLGDGESYVEVGSFKGLSLIAAMLGNAGDFVGIDNFSLDDGNRALLEANLRRYGLAGHTILEGDAFALLRARRARRTGASASTTTTPRTTTGPRCGASG